MMKNKITALLLTSVLISYNANANVDLGIAAEELGSMKSKYARDTKMKIPFNPENGFTKEKNALGEMLFFDPILSGSKRTSCATCHSPSLGFGDGLAKGIGDNGKPRPRKSQTLLNIAWDDLFNWDGKTEFLEKQAPALIENPGLMNLPIDQAIKRLNAIPGYKSMFKAAFPKDKDPVTKENIGKAIALYERTFVSGTAPFDMWIAGKENAISDDAKKGFVIFNKKGNCAACHSGWRFSDGSFHDIGLPSEDIGRGKLMPKVESMKFAFKTPTLRNITERDPYMHDGSLKSLKSVIDHYDNGAIKRKSLSSDIKRLNLTQEEKTQLLEFLKTLSSTDKPYYYPMLPRASGNENM